ncbi:transglutaminase family protein [Wenxinia saemankumensis]|uniref:Transglutaminase-like enzyme, putative cysteine protease n=1 Tax=Wenxinia saemankumensis TaxID=1447782 RepID=A0A1M6B5Y1_9RHOB|nr:transglutaminase family protein [Wenxinia saemankumensis]SHI44090.1 Transglutaminase-like enzyme, putative cysteine protease [Wenxinia saemankumensis]
MPKLVIDHSTVYVYRVPVALGPHRLMLRPRETRDLRLVEFELATSPTGTITWSQDVAGNAVAEAQFIGTAPRLAIRSRAIVDLSAPAWPIFPIAAGAVSWPFDYQPDDRVDLGALARPRSRDAGDRLSRWTRGFVLGEPTDTLSLLKDIANGVSAAALYEARETEGTQSPEQTLDLGRGTCRDLAVLLAEAVRTLGFGARVVSGYLYDPDDALIGAMGAGSTHAWVEIFVPGAGWIPFDPTNRAVGSANLIPVAVARRIEQVSPISGSHGGGPKDLVGLSVEVTVAPVEDGGVLSDLPPSVR